MLAEYNMTLGLYYHTAGAVTFKNTRIQLT